MSARAGLSDRANVHVGAGLDVLPALEKYAPFDVVFIDAQKENYDKNGVWALAHLRPGGLGIGDNAYLFSRRMRLGVHSYRRRARRQDQALVFPHARRETPHR